MQENDTVYQIETSEINQEKMKFIVVNRKPVKIDTSTRDNIEQELYKIFIKYV
ncbi:hypothetical protein [Anaerocolumna sp. MB42-C2]|uniref:hypothetical protein n=1 Tax=Anaerocolumna sp. MB42-C2 TaxID=3070997 RepID=UPI0027E010CF|nr:hypothetical protein [Anaerocolumna sp. MB42-C2]WMJ90413.1 hypothetical protein RBU59_13035 [Anaerocolumna sp. MB42-C2]